MEMDAAALLAVCKQHRLYQTPHLNDRLYCNFKGFTSIAGLEPYTGLRALFLEGNALDSAAGLPPLPELRCLFLQQNALISLVPARLAALPQLDTLNVSANELSGLEGLQGCAGLCTLLAADNQLEGAGALAPLEACPELQSVDLQNNKLGASEGEAAEVLALLARLPALKCLYLHGNPLVSVLRSYRKAVIAAIPTLTYLDDRPVFEVERLCAEAWARGGLEAEREARAAYHLRERERELCQVAAMREIRESGWRKRREALGLDPDGGDPYLEGLPAGWDGDEDGVGEEEPAELRQAWERLAAYAAERQGEEPPALVEADVQAVLEESAASRAMLLEGAGAESRCPTAITAADSGTSMKAVNSCPNSAAATPAPQQPAQPAAPEARRTVHLGGTGTAEPVAVAAADNDSLPDGAEHHLHGSELEQGRVGCSQDAGLICPATLGAACPELCGASPGSAGSASLACSEATDEADHYLDALD